MKPFPWRRPASLAVDAVDIGSFALAAASVAGLGHVGGGTCRQDAYGFGLDRDGRVCVVVADGLGSRAASHLGATIFCDSVVLIANSPASGRQPDPGQLIMAASRRTTQLAADMYGLTAGEVSCVAIVALLSPAGILIARVGDVTAFALDGKEFVELFRDESRYVNLVSAAIPADIAGAIETTTTAGTRPLLLVTDGLANDIRSSGTVRAWLADRWRQPIGPYAMADSVRFRRQGSHDDRTAVVVWPAAPDHTGPPDQPEL